MKMIGILIFLVGMVSCAEKETNNLKKNVDEYCNIQKDNYNKAKSFFLDFKRKEAMRAFEYTNNRQEFKKLINDEIEITEQKLSEPSNSIVMEYCLFLDQLNSLDAKEYNPFIQTVNKLINK